MHQSNDLSRMGEKDARDYVLHFTTELKLQRKQLSRLAQELDKWRGRVQLAGDAGRDELKRAAEERVIDLTAEQQKLQTSIEALEAEVARLIGQLRVHRGAGAALHFAEALADQLEAAVRGE